MHSIWLALLLPPMLFLLIAFQQTKQKSIWWICWSLSALVMLSVIIGTIVTTDASGTMFDNLLQKTLFSILRATDFPYFAFFIASSLNLAVVHFLPRPELKSKVKSNE